MRSPKSLQIASSFRPARKRTQGGAVSRHLSPPAVVSAHYARARFRRGPAYGDHIAKISVAPISPNLTDLTGDKVETSSRPDALREVIRDTMIELGGEWEVRVQLCTDLETMPIEDASKVWDEKDSPFIAVARLKVDPQVSWEHGTSDGREDRLSFSPWHGLAAHQPLGGVNRARNSTYVGSAQFRSERNGCPIQEPSSAADLSSRIV